MLSVDDFNRIKLVCNYMCGLLDEASLSFAQSFSELIGTDIILRLLLRRLSGLSADAALNPSRHLSEKE